MKELITELHCNKATYDEMLQARDGAGNFIFRHSFFAGIPMLANVPIFTNNEIPEKEFCLKFFTFEEQSCALADREFGTKFCNLFSAKGYRQLYKTATIKLETVDGNALINLMEDMMREIAAMEAEIKQLA